MTAALLGVSLYLFKRKFYDKIMPFTDVISMLEAEEFRNVIAGGVYLLCQFKGPNKSYVISNRNLMDDKALVE
jgi:hypothetical protein